jgi:hypothetical protein
MKCILPLIVAAATSTQALILAVATMTYTIINEGGQFGSPYCQIGAGDTWDEAEGMAADEGTAAYALYGGGDCTVLDSMTEGTPGDEFWLVSGWVNHVQDGRKYYCYIDIGDDVNGSCDAGDGVPSPYKRSRIFARDYAA